LARSVIGVLLGVIDVERLWAVLVTPRAITLHFLTQLPDLDRRSVEKVSTAQQVTKLEKVSKPINRSV
jgi:hypothetical protein